MNKSRELFLLFPYIGENVTGYSVVYKHTFLNDEPPYIMVSYWGTGCYKNRVYSEDGESVVEYLIRSSDVRRFITLMNEAQREYCDYYLEGVWTRNAGEHNLSAKQYAQGAGIRRPKVRYMDSQPIIKSLLS